MRVGGVAGERHAAVGLEALGRLHQGGEAGGGQVVAVHVAGHPGHDLADQVADQRDVGGHELVDVAWIVGGSGVARRQERGKGGSGCRARG